MSRDFQINIIYYLLLLCPPVYLHSQNNNLYENFFKYYKLTEREKEICELLLEHKQNKEIASRLFLSLGTVKTHIHNIYLKMEINRRRQIFELFEKSIFRKSTASA